MIGGEMVGEMVLVRNDPDEQMRPHDVYLIGNPTPIRVMLTRSSATGYAEQVLGRGAGGALTLLPELMGHGAYFAHQSIAAIVEVPEEAREADISTP